MLHLENLSKTVADQHLFAGVHWTIHPGDRVGLVGANGSGKSTLLRILVGQVEPDGGRVHTRSGLRLAYLPQEVEAEATGSATVLEAVLSGAHEVRHLGRELAALEDRLHQVSTTDDPPALAALTELYGEKRALFEWFGGDQLETRAQVVLGGLGFSPAEFQAPLATFSGGWRMRALMGRMLLSGAEVLLLDEPTNHLDLDALAWLEAQLGRTPAAVIVVSHDRVFLDRVVNRIAHLSRERIRIWPGNYSAWSARRAAERAADGERERKLAAEEKRLQEFVDRFRYKATKAAQAQERLKLLEGVQAERAAITLEHDRSWRLALAEPPASGDPVVQLHGVEKHFGDKCVLRGVDLTLRRGERLAVMGANGAGKTTLLRLIGGELFPERGRRLLGSGVTIGRFAQHQLEAMEPDRTVLEEALATAPGKRPEQVRQALGALGIGNVHVERRIRSLSGGERARVALARLVLNPSVVLLLDEPTNHLDLTMREALESGLAAWPGTLLVVSHDRAFLSAVTHGTLAVEAGLVERIAPGWESFLAWRASRRAAAPSAAPDQAAGGASAANEREARRQRAEAVQQRSRRLRPLKAELDQVERQIHDDEARQRTIDDQFADPAVAADGERMRALVAERAAIGTRLPTLYSRWEELSVEIESLSGPA